MADKKITQSLSVVTVRRFPLVASDFVLHRVGNLFERGFEVLVGLLILGDAFGESAEHDRADVEEQEHAAGDKVQQPDPEGVNLEPEMTLH